MLLVIRFGLVEKYAVEVFLFFLGVKFQALSGKITMW
jgi:hypothetical protein